MRKIKNILQLAKSNNGSHETVSPAGIFAAGFFLAQAVHYWQINEFGQMLWMCNIGNLLLAAGLFIQQPTLIRVAAIWMVPGVAVWFSYVVPTWGTLVTGQASAEPVVWRSRFNARTPGWILGWDVGVAQNPNGWTRVAACLRLVFHHATDLALNHAGSL